MLTFLTGAQALIAAAVEGHLKQEKLRGYEIKPAEVKAQPNSRFTAKAESSEFSISVVNGIT